MSNRTNRKWTEEEEELLLRQVRAFPQNLKKCFLIVSEITDRSPKAVTAHWYTVTSKKTRLHMFLYCIFQACFQE